MKFSPEKPHFFKPILPGFKNGLKIPIGFLKHLKEHGDEHAILRRGGNKWLVKLNGRRLEEGWQNFAEENGLQLGDFLVFKHEGDMEFEVFIFDSSQCERVNGWSQQVVHEREEAKKKPKSNIKTSGKAFPKVESAYKDMHLSHPHFICTIRPYCLSKHFLSIPKQFARENRLNNRRCTITMTDEQMSWTFSLYTNGPNTYFGRGWHEFCVANCLKEGDRLIFEIVSNGETPVFKFYDLRGSPSLQLELKKNNLDDNKRIRDKGLHFQEEETDLKKTSNVTAPKLQVPASTSADDANTYFISTIKPYTIKNPVLYLPLPFAKSNGLINRCCEMILIDEKRRSWSVQIGPMAPHFGIKSGLREFIKANNVQDGDTYKFELINNGTPPIAYFHCKYSGKDDDNDHRRNCQDNEAVGDEQKED